MKDGSTLTPGDIRAAQQDSTLRPRDLADTLGISEAELVAASVGHGGTRISPELDHLMPALNRLGEVMALTRNESCVIEKVGIYDKFHSGEHASMILNNDIDLRMFPKHWVHGYALETPTATGMKRSIQVFDAAGDAVHKVFLRETSVVEEWDAVVEALRLPEQGDTIGVVARATVEPPKVEPEKAEKLRAEWDKLTDTHQFLMMVRRLKLNRLGAYRMAGAPYVRPLATDSVATLLETAAAQAIPIMAFVGNMGCIEIHTGAVETYKVMGPWLNILDPGFNLHLRGDHISEVWQVTKSTKRGDAISVEAFDKDGALIVQFFGVLADPGAAARWNDLVGALRGAEA
ncbi:hemin-degrading factor [Shimia biformata]|uniref:hemin-degrading factor n=1 Tax=Shimia biformata TaxID=1294299 RepID=UPI003084438F